MQLARIIDTSNRVVAKIATSGEQFTANAIDRDWGCWEIFGETLDGALKSARIGPDRQIVYDEAGKPGRKLGDLVSSFSKGMLSLLEDERQIREFDDAQIRRRTEHLICPVVCSGKVSS